MGIETPEWAEKVMPQIKEVTKIEYAAEFYNSELIRLASGESLLPVKATFVIYYKTMRALNRVLYSIPAQTGRCEFDESEKNDVLCEVFSATVTTVVVIWNG